MIGAPDMPAGMRVAITGASGFLGARLVSWLGALPGAPEVIVLARRQTSDAKCKIVDLRREVELRAALEGCHAVVHCAFDFHDLEGNLLICEALARAVASVGARMVHMSTAAVHEPFPEGDLEECTTGREGGSEYKSIKLSIEALLCKLVDEIGLDVVILQPTVVYGPQGGAWTDSPIRELLTGTVVLPDAGGGFCNAVYVDDVCQAVARAMTADVASGERFLISGAGPVAWGDFYGAYCEILALDSLRLSQIDPARAMSSHVDAEQVRVVASRNGRSTAKRMKHLVTRVLGVRTASRLHLGVSMAKCMLLGAKTHSASGAKADLFRSRCNVKIEKARQLLGYRPQFDLEQGMAQTRQYILDQYAGISRLRRRRKTIAAG